MNSPNRLAVNIAAACLAALMSYIVGAWMPAFADNVAVATQHNDNARTGSNTKETVLTPAVVSGGNFGKLFTLDLDDDVCGQVLYVPKLTIDGAVHDTIFAYTGNGNNSASSLYAFDGDNFNNGDYLWRLQFPDSAEWTTCTPVIDTVNDVIYVLTKESDDSGPNQLHAIDLLTGVEKDGSPVTISASVPGTGDGSSGGVVTFDTSQQNCRPALLLVNGIVYVAFAHNSDSFPYHGWLFGYQHVGGKFKQTAVFCTTPNGGQGGIWQAGNGIVADKNGFIYCSTGNGVFDANTPGDIDYGMCYLKLSTPSLSVVGWFSPFDESGNSNSDLDLGGAGPVGISNTDRLFAGGTKFGSAFLLDTTHMGGFTPGGPDNVLNRINGMSANNEVGQNPVSWDEGPQKFIYVWPNGSNLKQFRYLTSSGKIVPNNAYLTYGATDGAQLSVSSDGESNGILWAECYDNVIRAFHAGNVSKGELWDSNMNAARDGISSVGHWQFITVVNGHVYVPTGNSQICVYGILPGSTKVGTSPASRPTKVAESMTAQSALHAQ